MSWGLPMLFTTENDAEEINIILRPYRPEEALNISGGISSHHVSQYMSLNRAQTSEDSAEWLQKMSKSDTDMLWAVCIGKDANDKLGTPIGSTGLHKIHESRASSGFVIYDTSMWGKGIASACHRARCFYAHHILGLKAIDSEVAYPNIGSYKALLGVGYTEVGTRYSGHFTNGKWHHIHQLTWVNPHKLAWDRFWDANEPTAEFVEARKRARKALRWAETNITFL